MNVILDTNILVSAFAIGGKPRVILDLVISKTVFGYTSETLLHELSKSLLKFALSPAQLQDVEQIVRDNFIIVNPKEIPVIIIRDPDDDHVLAITHEVDIDYIISGDKDLLILGQYNKIPIIKPADFLTDNKFKSNI